ncbi:MAG: DUF2059 domain-containing protein [Pseudomonadota bacterium]
MMRLALLSLAFMSATPATAQAPDPARLPVAASIASQMLPDGTFQKMMSNMLDGVMNSVMDGMAALPLQSVAKMAGEKPEKVKALGPATLRDLMQIVDPAYQQRFQIMSKVMGVEMGRVMTKMEPTFREAMAEVYAARFDEKQLREIDIFFRTPTGRMFAEQSMMMQSDPVFLNRMKVMVPEIMEAMPEIMKRVAEATADLPKPRNAEDLTSEEKKRIAELLGTVPEKVKS